MVRPLLIAAVLCPALLAARPAGADEPADPQAALGAPAAADRAVAVERYLDRVFARTNGRVLRQAKRFIPQVVAAAEAEGLDPLLVAVVIFCESTWKPKSVGKAGEVGLMQVHGEAARGFDVATLDGNLAAGCRWLASRIAKHGSVDRGMVAYMGDSDRARKMGKYRMDLYRAELARQGLTEPGK